jgi:hypothetical protein
MSATQELIAAALTAADELVNPQWPYFRSHAYISELSVTLREACARAMVQPDMAEVPMPDIAGELFDGKRVCDEAKVRTYGDAREAAGYAAGVTSGAKQMFDYIQFAAANTSDTEWDTRLCELSQDALAAVSPAAHTEWKTIQRVASESRAAGEAAGYARGLAAGGKDAERLDFLSRQFVTVRTPMRYGSIECITGMPTDGDGESKPWDIRAAIDDAALRGEVKP